MSFVRFAAMLLVAFAAGLPAMAAPLEAYGKLPTIEAASVSPSGHAVAMIITNGEQRAVMVQDLSSQQRVLQTTIGALKVRALRWAGDKHLIIVTSVTASPMFLMNARREWFMGFTFDVEARKVRPLLRITDHPESMNTLASMPQVRTVDGKPTVLVQGVVFQGGRGRLSLFKQGADSDRSSVVETGGEDTTDWVIGPEGEALAQELYDDRSGRWSLKVRSGAGWREVTHAVAPYDPPYALGVGRDGRSVVVARHADGRLVWQETGLEGPAADVIPVLDGQAPIYDPADGRLIGYSTPVGDDVRHTFFDPEDARIWKAVAAAYPNDIVELVSWSNDRRKVVIRADSPTEGPAYAVVDLNTKAGRWLGPEYMSLKAEDISRKEAIRFQAADGLELTGYLTLPRGRDAKALPLVVFPHGGPASRDEPGFDWWAQAMASRGYAVLQVNFRGSQGLGAALLEAGYGQWGRKMQTDLSDGVRYLAAQGIIDPKRVCIVGASYGGYAALAGAVFDRGVYRCAASVAGVSDLKRQVAYSRSRGGQSTLRYWTRFMGAEDLGDPVLAAYSPALQAAKADIPVLLVHGKDDTVVPIEQSRIMADALHKAGKPVEFVVQKGADHWLSLGDTRLQTLESVVRFLERYNPPN